MGNYFDTCSEYMAYVQSPSPSFDCGDWNEQFSNWSAVQIWLYILVGIIWILWSVYVDCGCVGHMVSHFAVGVLIAYLFAHFGWYIVVSQGGCIHPIICLLVGILYILHGLNWVSYALNGNFHASYHLHYHPSNAHAWGDEGDLLRRILYGVYALSLLYMGVAAAMIFISGQAGGGGGEYSSRGLELKDLETESDVPLTDRTDQTVE
eukprot:gnl/MRDRNA2_/MRDRNA2_267551_c0_seq1.p1 gnl/MRDRNA2_/MRDRNA2_267551_c0~~gnl/MRDRNA2_/MRDRNA2_267551_c0_seq1.p1  ORF type:complete len:239 (+),score=16.99 gnl/MRDRNA2_/MRDRNA2_267551_c0_seq1:97-717(+)